MSRDNLHIIAAVTILIGATLVWSGMEEIGLAVQIAALPLWFATSRMFARHAKRLKGEGE